MKRYEHLKTMNAEEIAAFCDRLTADNPYCRRLDGCMESLMRGEEPITDEDCRRCIRLWLGEEVERSDA